MAASNNNATGDAGIFSDVYAVFDSVFQPIGLETHPFQVDWYNQLVGPRFALSFEPNTVAFVVISGPDTFEKSVLPYLKSAFQANPNLHTNDPLDDAMVNAFDVVKKQLQQKNLETEVYHDFDLYPSRKPKVLVQTAAHVAGAVQYFHKNKLPLKIQEERFSKSSDLCGVAVHPVYGGWFAIRGVIIMKNLELNEDKQLPRPVPLNLIPSDEIVANLLEQFAYNWEEDKWRSIYKGTADQEYSQAFKDFLTAKPGTRWEFVKQRGFLTDQ